jgi:hypothetical protein
VIAKGFLLGKAFSFMQILQVIWLVLSLFQREYDMKKLKGKICVSIAVVMAFVVFATPILAQQGEIMAGRMAGEQSARANVNGNIWMLAGCVGSWLGVLLAYIYEPTPPATMLLGKSPEYVAAYTDAYRATAKSIQISKVWTGCIISGVLYLVYVVLVVAAAESST